MELVPLKNGTYFSVYDLLALRQGCAEAVEMDLWIDQATGWLDFLVPAIALWAVVCLHMQPRAEERNVSQAFYVFALLLVAALTVRTVTTFQACWLVHTASLGSMIVAGVLYRPEPDLLVRG
ncbi:MAG: hypothetical protein KatS3mg111_0623 [Pirellulaceae bacterium]|nr:MAG: hypothetical protein KatS3mg111_0623 [Pirellulaceae bacterium]